MDMEITKLNGDSFRLSEYGVTVRDFIVGSIPLTGDYGFIEGRAGAVDYGAEFGQRTISVPFYAEAVEMGGYPLIRDRLFSFIVSKEPFYIRELRRMKFGTGEDRYVGGKRYKVRLSGELSLEQQMRYGFGELAFLTVDLPFAESVGTSMDIHRNGIDAEDALWGFGMGLIPDNDSLTYVHTGTSFRVYNPSDVLVHPFEQELKITLSDPITPVISPDFLALRNTTTGNTFRVNESPPLNIVLDGPNITRSGTNYYRNTNGEFITLAPGWNEFEVTGVLNVTTEFDFRFYYK